MHSTTEYNAKMFVYPDGSIQARSYKKMIVLKETERTLEDIAARLPVHDCPFGGVAYEDKKGELSAMKRHLDLKKQMASADLRQQSVKNDDSVRRSLTRTKSKLNQYVRSSDWEWFLTFTVNPALCDSMDYTAVRDRMTNWLSNVKKRFAPKMQYIVVPEQHKSGAWHFHGLFRNIGSLRMVQAVNPHTGQKIVQRFKNGVIPVFNCANWSAGFTTATQIFDSHRAGQYLLKYITKDMLSDIPNRQRYFASKGLALPRVITRAIYDYTDMPDIIYQALVDAGLMCDTLSVDYAKRFASDWCDVLLWEISV